jgi:4-diphosphocytidyl-2-C-methyl-D-erythritol kinase
VTESVTVAAPAKINWMLRVLDRRADGYHNIETLFQTISLHDEITITPAETFELDCDDSTIPVGRDNLVLRAAILMRERFSTPLVRVQLRKRIPAGGGLGGGSSDAAAVLVALSRRFVPQAEPYLPDLALQIGSDVPFFLIGGTAYGTGRGEVVTPLPSPIPIPLLLSFPGVTVSTADAYRWLDKSAKKSSRVGASRIRDLVLNGLLGGASELTNDFERVVFQRMPELGAIKREMLASGAAWSGMSGSGSTIVAAFRDVASRDEAAAKLAGQMKVVSAMTT